MGNESKSPLDNLFVDGKALDEQLLVDTIGPHIRLYRDTAEIAVTDKWKSLNIPQKILVYLLARKVLHIKGLIEEEKITPSQLEDATGLKGGSLRPALSKLLDDRLVRQDKDGGGYWVPNFAISDVADLIGKKGKNDAD